MKGTIVSTWINTLEEQYGNKVIEKAKKSSIWDEELIISPLMDIEDEKAFDLIETVAGEVNKNAENLWREIGRKNIYSFQKWFPSYFKGRKLKPFLMKMNAVHQQLTSLISGANPPDMPAEEIDEKTIRITYSSHRGMFNYFLGLLEGSSEYFEEDININILEQTENNDLKKMIVDIEFVEEFEEQKNYMLSKLFSLGKFNKIKYKVGILVFITTLILGGISGIINEWAQTILFSLGNGFLVFLLTHFLISPLKAVNNKIEELKDLNLIKTKKIASGDELESLNINLNEAKENIGRNILFLKGGSDDLYNFTNEIKDISDEMKKVSDNISTVVEEVANGAQEQAEETEDSVYLIENNINNINQLAETGNKSKNRLKKAVNKIQNSAGEIQNVNQRIDMVRNEFADINQQGKELTEKISELMNIVNTVADFAKQTNLLALNASIEAANSSDNSRGFSVVADEIRELAEDSRDAGGIINDRLENFTDRLNNLVEDISSQFSSLENSNQILKDVTNNNEEASKEVDNVSQDIVNIVEELNSETQKINKVMENLNSLAAIAEENSAASEEMSASVEDYSQKIKDITTYIDQMEELVNKFKKGLLEFRI